MFFAEGVVTYLEAETFRKVLRDVRSLATPGTRLALSLPRSGPDGTERARFEEGVAGLGEPALGSVTVDDSEAVLLESRWRAVDLKDRATASGFVMAAPVFTATNHSVQPTIGRIGRFVEDTLSRRGGATLAAHLEATYDIDVRRTRELDLGVFRIEKADGSAWIARVFPATRAPRAARADAEILDWLNRAGIPAERTATPDPVSVHEGQPVLLTDFAPGRHPATKPVLFEELGVLLAKIHGLPGDTPAAKRLGGAWHHLLLDATVSDELTAARKLLHDARHRVQSGHGAHYDRLHDALDDVTLPSDLPAAFVHPDFVPRNIIRNFGGGLTIVDWSGSGVGPRLASLGCLLWSASGHGPSLEAAVRGYGSSIALKPVELEHVRPAMALRPVILLCWSFATGRSSVVEAATSWSTMRPKLAKAALRAGALLAEAT